MAVTPAKDSGEDRREGVRVTAKKKKKNDELETTRHRKAMVLGIHLYCDLVFINRRSEGIAALMGEAKTHQLVTH